MWKFVWEVIKPFRLIIIGMIIVSLTWAIDVSLRPYIFKIIINKIPNLNADNIIQELTMPVISYIGMALIIMLIFRFYDFLWMKLNPGLKLHIGDILTKRMMKHSVTTFQDQFAGSLANKIKDVMSGTPDIIRLIIYQFLSHILAFIIAIFAVWTINYKFSILLFSWVCVFVGVSLISAKTSKRLSKESSEMRSKVVGKIVDILSNITSIHLFAGRKIESKLLMVDLNQYAKADKRRDWYFAKVSLIQGMSFVIYQAASFWLLIDQFQKGTVLTGEFVLIISINTAIVNCLWSVSSDILKLAEIIGNIKQGLDIVLSPINIEDKPTASKLIVTQGEIKYENVKFHYKGVTPLFANKSIIIKAGERVGLVGYSGGGKTTFVNLILRLYDVTEGAILIDEQDIRDVTQDSLHESIGMIPQEPSLFHRSLLENIRYGRPDASDAEVIEAAKKAHAHEFIMKLPEGYESLVGERGVKLSGGQRQRIAIARAILKNAPILMLDEATSQLDSITENYIQDSLNELMQDKTTIVIAHRLSTLLKMDRILVFESGKIVEDGSHEELLAKSGLYKNMWEAQIGGFLPEKIED